MEKNIQEIEITASVRIEMSPKEKDRAAKSLAEAVDVNKNLLAERTAMSNDYNTRIKENQGVMNREAKIVKHGFEEVETLCTLELDRTTGLCRIRREVEGDDGRPIWVQKEWEPISKKHRTIADAALQPELPGSDGSGDDPTEGLDTSE